MTIIPATYSGTKDASLTSRYAAMDREEFNQEVERTWGVVGSIKLTITQEVKKGNLRPLDAVRALSSVTASLFGYEEFHGRQTPNPMALISSVDQ